MYRPLYVRLFKPGMFQILVLRPLDTRILQSLDLRPLVVRLFFTPGCKTPGSRTPGHKNFTAAGSKTPRCKDETIVTPGCKTPG